MNTFLIRSVLTVGASILSFSAFAGTGTFLFNGNLNAQEGGVNAMTATDPTAGNSYGSAFLYGANRTTYNTLGSAGAGNNAGLSLDASTLVPANSYSLEMVVSFSNSGGWRKLADVSGRASDGGYYIDPASKLNIYPNFSGTTVMNTGTYYYLALTVASNGDIKGYVNGALELTANSSVMNGNVFDFFLDDSATGFNEYSNVSVGLVRLTDSVLSDSQISTLSANPYGGTVPEPASLTACVLGFGALVARRKKAK